MHSVRQLEIPISTPNEHVEHVRLQPAYLATMLPACLSNASYLKALFLSLIRLSSSILPPIYVLQTVHSSTIKMDRNFTDINSNNLTTPASPTPTPYDYRPYHCPPQTSSFGTILWMVGGVIFCFVVARVAKDYDIFKAVIRRWRRRTPPPLG